MTPSLLRLALILGLLSCIGPFAIDMYLPALPAISADLQTETALTQWTLMSYFLAFGLFQLVYGPVSDAVGRKPAIYFGLTVFGVASVGCALAPSIEWLIVMRFFQGMGTAAVMSIPRAMVRDLYTGPKATRLMSTVMLVIAISPMLAPLVGSIVIVPFGWRAVFYTVALAALGSVLLTRYALPETLPTERRVGLRWAETLRAFRTLLKDPFYIGVTLIGGLGMASFFAFLATASFLYIDYYGLTETQFSLAFALNAIGFFSASQVAANLGARFGTVSVVKWAIAGFAAASLVGLTLVMTGAMNFRVLVATLMITYAFLGLVIPSVMVLALEYHGPIAGSAAALGGTIQMMIGAVSIAVSSAIFNGTPLPLIATISSCALLALMLSQLTLREPQPSPVQ